MTFRHPWSPRLLAALSDELTGSAVSADDPLWEKTETELVKLGSLAHSEVNLDAVALDCLTLLETRTKDMRVLVQLVRCLQHPATTASWSAALILMNDWLSAWWMRAWPNSPAQKLRLMVQMVRRFEGAQARLCERATGSELEEVMVLIQTLARTWGALMPEQGGLFDELVSTLQRAARHLQAQNPVSAERLSSPASSTTAASPEPVIRNDRITLNIDDADERAWQQTLLKVADRLTEHQPGEAVGYRLRRYAIWHTITSPPVVSRGNRTPLAAVSSDRVSEYESALACADITLWRQTETSLSLSPYWFDGHWLSAQMATVQGFAGVSNAIRDELLHVLHRLPALRTLTFSDDTPFLSSRCEQWLRTAETERAEACGDVNTAIGACREEQGLNAALALLEDNIRSQSEPREAFYAGLMLAELLDAEGMVNLAEMHYRQLWQQAQRLSLEQWEPGLVERLERAVRARH
ncbi:MULTISPECIES: type VI secretion system protein TssA [Lelliottia]|uniref:Type VI secretion system protein TssA n=2 Tax=Enterobacteriaceae TaxID=543 RepID=A0ABX5A5P0_9ENTR|nr:MULTISPECIES: type VI secretion system protein TssA [Lelliottia]POZ25997.1 type VI secretion system protein TssA [Lelliottia aquatilis]POZ29154.1 type VI secretion system protein TssA [Lelliottia sp. 7254-16]POZ29552.1 type VI secretion system protein TssA [Lelliottia aquatilis]POZ33459.1 type VI secretion system protein TssA [Lelliottia aquatilis]POZ39780.1 type VI secretion system protein TssA [Lelliottia aquatilis]